MRVLLFSPVISFMVIFVGMTVFAALLSRLSLRTGKKQTEDAGESYGCGEDVESPRVQPDYGQFFPFAFFFTILHVVTLMVTTLPVATLESLSIAVVYIAGAAIGLVILFRR